MKLLGPGWVAWRGLYALRQRLGVVEWKTPIEAWQEVSAPEITGKCFPGKVANEAAVSQAEEIRQGRFIYFFCHHLSSKNRKSICNLQPDWFANPFEEQVEVNAALSQSHWSKISDFENGDIKCVWELSRFAWAYPLIQAYRQTGQEVYSETFWKLVVDWALKNPPNRGVNWKCGQEISVRMLAVVSAYFAFSGSKHALDDRKQLLRKLLFASAKRIEANIGYALSQDNNHGVSEATGLFTAGVMFGNAHWTQKGKRILEIQARHLIYRDGSFSQHSTNYHRVMLHNYLWSIAIGRKNGISFSDRLMDKICKAGMWLNSMMDRKTGRAPNLGANDGAQVLPVAGCDYLDFRPTVQAVGAVLDGQAWLPDGPCNGLADWLGAEFGGQRTEVGGQRSGGVYFANGGYAVIRDEKRMLLFRCPEKFTHRPSQCDLLHVDLWADGINILRDGGTYSYNCEQPWQDYFKSVKAHNTIAFDEHDQMPQLSRFLYGKWPKMTVECEFQKQPPKIEASYTDWKGCRHKRIVEFGEKIIRVLDEISSFKEKAVLRWRLAPEIKWSLEGNTCPGGPCMITVNADHGIKSLQITEGWESLYYMQKAPVPVFEATVTPECATITTEIQILN